MQNTHRITNRVREAAKDMKKADRLIRTYIPFIRSETSKFTGRPCLGEEDEYSIAMIAFHEAIRSYNQERGAFLSYAALIIRSRLADWRRKEARHTGHLSIYEETGEETAPLHTVLADRRDEHVENENLQATKDEIAELAKVMAKFDVTFTDVAENSPKQERTLKACRSVIQYAVENKEILDKLLSTGKLPVSQLASGTAVERKTLERHRKYIVAMLLIQTNGYEIIRGHIKRVLRKGGAL